ncbi:MAG: hypothetical protein DHS80DRAFT_24700 [Piptocephalis tieghemiana]|nr:MAG: hypothetical protein DHS80DRAFT_24700 [Piptocephalis tieghemiana]
MGATTSHPAEWSIPRSPSKSHLAREAQIQAATAAASNAQSSVTPGSTSGSATLTPGRHRSRTTLSPSSSPTTSYFPEAPLSPHSDSLAESEYPYAPGYTNLLSTHYPSKAPSASSTFPSHSPVRPSPRPAQTSSITPSSSSESSSSASIISSKTASTTTSCPSSELNLSEFLRIEGRTGGGSRLEAARPPRSGPLPLTPAPSKSWSSQTDLASSNSDDPSPPHTSRAGFGKRASLTGLGSLRSAMSGGGGGPNISSSPTTTTSSSATTPSSSTAPIPATPQKIRMGRGAWAKNRKPHTREKMGIDEELAFVRAQAERGELELEDPESEEVKMVETQEQKDPALPDPQSEAFRSFSEASRLLMEKQGSRMLTMGKPVTLTNEEKEQIAEQSATSIHLALWYVMQRSHLVPILFNNVPLRILDVNPGTSKWAEFFAHEHPLATIMVLGNGGVTKGAYQGLSGTNTIQHYPHCTPTKWPLPAPNATFDLVRQTCLGPNVNVSAWVTCLTDLYRITLPGGWTEVVELDGKAYNCGKTGEEITKWIASVLNQSGVSLSVCNDIPIIMQEIGYMDIHSREFALPLGGWAGAVGHEVGKFMKSWMTHMRSQAPPECDVSEIVWSRWMRRMLEDSAKESGYLRCVVVIGRRPPYDDQQHLSTRYQPHGLMS